MSAALSRSKPPFKAIKTGRRSGSIYPVILSASLKPAGKVMRPVTNDSGLRHKHNVLLGAVAV